MDKSAKGQIRSLNVAGKRLALELRLLNEKDVPSIRDISSVSFPKVWKESEFAYFVNHASGLCYGAFVETKLIGYLLALLVQGDLDIISIAIEPKYRRMGIGKILIEHCWEENEISEGFLEVDSENDAAVKLYESVGFKKYGIRRKYYDGKKDALVMKKTKG